MAAAIQHTLAELMSADPSIVLMGDVVGRVGGVAGSTAGLLERFGSERVWDAPIADRAVMGAAVGMAIGGQRPVVELSSTGRLAAVLEVLREAALIGGGEFSIPLIIRIPYGTEAGDRIDQAVIDMFASCPGVQVVTAADAGAAGGLLRSAARSTRPVVILEPRRLYGAFALDSGEALALDKARSLREGDQVTVAGWGASVATCLAVAERLESDGISAQVVDLVSLAPVDRASLGEWVKHTGRLVVVHPSDDSVAERVLRVGLEEAFLYLESPLAVVADDADAAATAARVSVAY